MSLFRRAEPTPAPASVEAGTRIYAFGDVHGRADLLAPLMVAIATDVRRSASRNVVIGLGDYVDRGPDSRSVIEMLSGGIAGCELVLLRGNHEQMLLGFLEDPARYGGMWLTYGAQETLRSYGVPPPAGSRQPSPQSLSALREALVQALPLPHLTRLQRMPVSHSSGDYVFVHAGVRLGTPLAEQATRDLLWIREGFADRDRPFEKVVVHGHTPVKHAFFGQYRINIDTGAYLTNRLTCLLLEGATRRLFAA